MLKFTSPSQNMTAYQPVEEFKMGDTKIGAKLSVCLVVKFPHLYAYTQKESRQSLGELFIIFILSHLPCSAFQGKWLKESIGFLISVGLFSALLYL